MLCGARPQGCQQSLDLAAAALDDRGELGALGDRHAHALDDHVDDALGAARGANQPVDLNRRPARNQDQALDDDDVPLAGAGGGDLEGLAGVPAEARGVDGDDEFLEQAQILGPLRGRGATPVPPQDDAADGEMYSISPLP